MTQKKGSIQYSPIVSPLFLPQIYSLLAYNSQKLDQDLLKYDLRAQWESEFLAVIKILRLRHKDGKTGPYWDESLSQEIVKSDAQKNKSLNSFMAHVFAVSKTLKGLYADDIEKLRLDPCVTVPCQAVGLAKPDDSTEKAMTEPTPFFEEIIRLSGATAAVFMLARMLSIPEWTISEIDWPVNDRDIEDFGPRSSSKYQLDIFTDSVFGWLKDHGADPNDRILKRVRKLVEKMETQNIVIDRTEMWWKNPPPREILKGVANIVYDGLQTEPLEASLKEKINKDMELILTQFESRPMNLIFMGPPGTGKSRILNYIASDLVAGKTISTNNLKTYIESSEEVISDDLNMFKIQFHPSYGYEDFVEGIRPVQNLARQGFIRYSVTPGPLKVAADLADVYMNNYRFLKLSVFITVDAKTQKKFLKIPEEYSLYRLPLRDGQFFYFDEQSGRYKLAVERDPAGQEIKAPLARGYQTFFWRPHPDSTEPKNFVVVIDELNRGNPSKIFGEVLTLVEPTKRKGQPEQVSIFLPSSKEILHLPSNLHILCSMNVADRSLATLDQAFRRRFKFVYLKPDWSLIEDTEKFKRLSGIHQVNKKLQERVANHFRCINEALGAIDIAEDNYIGHSYAFAFLKDFYSGKYKDIKAGLLNLWENDLHALLREIITDRVDDFVAAFDRARGKVDTFSIDKTMLVKFLSGSSPADVDWLESAA